MIGARSTLAEVAFAVCTALEQAGYQAVLTGGLLFDFGAREK